MEATTEQMVIEELRYIRSSLDELKKNGCAKASLHKIIEDNQEEIFLRLHAVENAQAEGRGKLAMIVAGLSAASGLLFAWIGKHLT